VLILLGLVPGLAEDVVGVEGRLDALQECEPGRWLERQEVGTLGGADAVLAGDRAARLEARRQHGGDELGAAAPIGLEHREVHVAVTHVAAAGDEGLVGLGQRADRRQ